MRFINRTKQKIARGEPVYGLFCSNPSPLTVEMIAAAGYDFVIIDMEHTLTNPETIQHMIRAAEVFEITPLVRVPERSPGAILQVLDAGAQGVVVPHVRNRADLMEAMEACYYTPKGKRSLNGGRNARFGADDLREVMERANREVMFVPMIEDKEALEHLDEILSVEGIDFVLEGAADLSGSLGVPWQTQHPEVKEALRTLHERAVHHGVPYGTIPRNKADRQVWWDKGVRVFVVGDDRGIFYRALKSQLSEYVDQVQVEKQ
ncbi:siderophore biosynthesis protein SbnG [Laceyella sacchari]|uniref:4-hydroxy-2-oxoheptanedioate aldolase n=1 Tax=Laceyella tengchongensis TaxID=574699 RepID=A0AA46AD64_9BACL|nr:aldolase/citrate lyase family protein [Laceyella tengchongensis]AUS08116.1 siderophore biosynthesis protein SbnG [Laceyella sacchari]MRG28433.1 siderophore biosynthesis protein SbnG [Laceyella tengchongensis]SMP02888.1 4-hydroxy-2-oxoheptanedioate aldolase [Laceyella tengchongensis]